MEVILREDVEKLGSRGQVVKVKDGFARNYLLPRRIAITANEGNKKIVEQERQSWLRKEAKIKVDAEGQAQLLNGITLEFARKAGEEDHLFGSVTSGDIEEGLTKKGFNVDKKKIRLEEPIKVLGEHKVIIHLYKDVDAEITVNVVKEA
ncbi:50S ribosomal protein L9 [Bryobacter aggregatus]|uniref:50S ribosomal protein L9 n=1 Tax=Bryobacter aggregatus TaxID=360054 RepID=UPI0004E28BB9|nr:50S ribosomal protein L9 [Bryobacter aggregatus]